MTQKPMLRAEVCALLSSSGHPQKCVSLTKGTKRAVAALLIPVHLPHLFVCNPLEGSARARLLVSMQLASSQHARSLILIPPNTDTWLISCSMIVYLKFSTGQTTCPCGIKGVRPADCVCCLLSISLSAPRTY